MKLFYISTLFTYIQLLAPFRIRTYFSISGLRFTDHSSTRNIKENFYTIIYKSFLLQTEDCNQIKSASDR